MNLHLQLLVWIFCERDLMTRAQAYYSIGTCSCRDGTGQISREPCTKMLETRQQHLPRLSKHMQHDDGEHGCEPLSADRGSPTPTMPSACQCLVITSRLMESIVPSQLMVNISCHIKIDGICIVSHHD